MGCTLKTAYTSQSQRDSSIVFENAEECGFEGKYTHRPTPGETSPDPITTLCLAGVCFARYISQHSAISYQTNLENDETAAISRAGHRRRPPGSKTDRLCICCNRHDSEAGWSFTALLNAQKNWGSPRHSPKRSQCLEQPGEGVFESGRNSIQSPVSMQSILLVDQYRAVRRPEPSEPTCLSCS